jgi:hypothetical protein
MLSMSAQRVVAELRAAGSTDPRVLVATKDTLVKAQKSLRLMSWLFIAIGLALMLTAEGAFVGIPLVAVMVWAQSRVRRNMAIIHATYDDYLGARRLVDPRASDPSSVSLELTPPTGR